MRSLAVLLLLAGLAPAQQEKKKVMCTLPVLQAIAQEIGGDDFEVVALSKPDQDPHFVSPTPSLMKKLREADLFVEIGLALEIWANELANNSGKPKLMQGGHARIVASKDVSRLQVPEVLSRTEGDVHPEGNPHIWLDPLRAKTMAANIADGMIRVAPDRKSAVEERLKKFQRRIDEAVFGRELVEEVGGGALARKVQDGTLFGYLKEKGLEGKTGGWLKKAEPLRGQKVVEYHKSWIYLAKTLGFEIVGAVQPKPGIEPGPKHLRELADLIRAKQVKVLLVDNYFNVAYARSLAEETGAKAVVVPSQPGGEPGTETYFKFVDHVIERMLEALK